MAPNSANTDPLINDAVEDKEDTFEKLVAPQAAPRKFDIRYRNLFTFGIAHLGWMYGVYLMFTAAKWQTSLYTNILIYLSGLGITAGAHRLWAHKTYKAKLPLEIFLMFLNTICFQNSAIEWVRDHRLHHKYSDTDADPHNATRGFFYSHVGWLLVKKHPEVLRRGKLLDMSDIINNPVLKFQRKYQLILVPLITVLLPMAAPMYFWGESLKNAFFVSVMYRYITILNGTFLVNSAAHLFGNKPYDKFILPSENRLVSLIALGEGFHNYHHVFPWDYRTGELGNNYLNFSTKFIDLCAYLGLAYDLKCASNEMVISRAKRTGDGSAVWGWGDQELSKEDQEGTIITHSEKVK